MLSSTLHFLRRIELPKGSEPSAPPEMGRTGWMSAQFWVSIVRRLCLSLNMKQHMVPRQLCLLSEFFSPASATLVLFLSLFRISEQGRRLLLIGPMQNRQLLFFIWIYKILFNHFLNDGWLGDSVYCLNKQQLIEYLIHTQLSVLFASPSMSSFLTI